MQDGKANILIVDDRPEKLLALEAVLEDLGENIVRAYSGREALRHVLGTEFAVILLDVNMPGMDGFETASLIRQRKNNERTPIIFITAFGDEIHQSRGYSLGAVDYIQAPVIPDVLRTKVTVFVELFKKTEQVKRQAESLRRRTLQLQKLATASVAINSALSVEKMLQTITDTARDVIGSHQAITVLIDPRPGKHGPRTQAYGSYTDKYAEWRGRPLDLERITQTIVARSHSVTRMTEPELREHPDWEIVSRLEIPPIQGGMIACPLAGRDGGNLGVIYLCDRNEGNFNADDEAVLLQLAQMASIAVENTFFAEEREANRIKDEFLATLSHELRTPLNAILGWTQLLRMEECTTEVGHGLDVIDRNARSQTKLIEDLLDVSRITTGKMRVSIKPAQLPVIITAAIEAVRLLADAKGVRLESPASLPVEAIHADPDRLQQVVWNLLSNAIKFTDAGGTVRLVVERVDNPARVRIRVSDSGLGIDRKFLPHVFDRFRQADSTSTRAHSGLGIGLTIVRHLVELHGGAVSADSAGVGHGSTFTVELPLAAPLSSTDARRAPASTAPAMRILEARNDRRLPGVRILLVDDEPDARDVVTRMLRREEADVTTAASAAEALQRIQEPPGFDVLLSDIAMPEQDGYALIAKVRSLPDGAGTVPAIALTAYAREEDRARALAAGFVRHLTKPLDPEELIEAVQQTVGQPTLQLRLA